MSAKVLSKAAAKEAKIDLIEDGRGTQAVHDAVVAMRAARRSGSANTKSKAEVNLSGAKPWRQKGTGRARAGYKSSPIWRGGGVVFGPKPRDDAQKVLILSDSFDDNTYKAARNVKPVLLTTAANVNAEQLLAFDKILVTPAALEHLAERMNRE